MEFEERYGPWALIAGASEGIGAAFAHALARRGLGVVLVARREAPLRALERELGPAARVRSIPLDLSRPDAAAQLALELADLDVGLVVYNAALSPVGAFLDVALADQLAAVDVNVRTPIALLHHFGKRLAARGRGGLVVLSSLTAFQGSPFVATYGGTKSFLLAWAEGLWFELAPRGVDVLAVCAGATRTPSYLRHATRPAPGELAPQQVAEEALDRLGRAPSMVPGRFNRIASQLMRRLLSRRATIRIMGGQTGRLTQSR